MTKATNSTVRYATDRIISVRAKAFAGRGVESIRATVDSDGTVRVYDSVAGHYTTCHALCESTERRIRGWALVV